MRQKASFPAKLTIWVLTIISIAYGLPAKAADVGTDFYSQCPLLLQKAPSFAQECLLHARPWGRIFNYEPESHSAYLVAPRSASDFTLGCTLDDKHRINYLGVYYTLNSDNFKYANSAPLAFVDFEGNFGIVLKEDLINFVAIRRFPVDLKLANPYYMLSMFTGCAEPASFPKGAIPDARGSPYYISKMRVGAEIWITGCVVPGVCNPSKQYIEITQDKNEMDGSNIIYTPDAAEVGSFFVTGEGGTLIPALDLKKYCPIYLSAQSEGKDLPLVGPNLIRQVCLMGNKG